MLEDKNVLGPKELEEMGLNHIFGPTPTQEATEVAITSSITNMSAGGMYTPEEDVTETLPDGRTIQVAVKGVAIPMAQAIAAGLVKPEVKSGPKEKK